MAAALDRQGAAPASCERTVFGFRYAAIRRPIKDAATHDYVRTTLFIAPYTVHIPPNNLYRIAAPCTCRATTTDDRSISSRSAATPTPSTRGVAQVPRRTVGIDSTRPIATLRTRANNYLQDRQAMKLGNFTGIRGIPNQDIVMWETMGPIADRTHDRLGASDLAIVEFRKQMVEAATHCRRRRAGDRHDAAAHSASASSRSFEGIVPKTADWRTLGATEEELAIRREQQAEKGKQHAAE